MTYTINGKEWTEFDINKRCAVLMGLNASESLMKIGNCYIPTGRGLIGESFIPYDPCSKPEDTDAIIDKCWDELMTINSVVFEKGIYSSETEWNQLMDKHNCTKLVAACICYIEINEAAL
jgi:hypothetical protein